ncbi:MAG: YqcC family protein [Gammaproteobacteria bacterium]|nr:YqcC family protein [Gammaproteobacteria bacterium]MDH5693462.1 YqcC family protein [Gammaproteobacteria bacterium]
MRKSTHSLASIILLLEAEMRKAGLWEDKAPPREAINSNSPFCYDTLRFSQWLQWVFLPKVKTLLENDEILPKSSHILPYAYHTLNAQNCANHKLLLLINEFDQIINRSS